MMNSSVIITITTDQDKMSGKDSQVKKAAEALRRENERIEAENRRRDKEIADLLRKIKNATR